MLAPGGAGFSGRTVAAFSADRLQAQSGWWDTGNYAVALVGATAGDGDIVGSGAVVTAGDVLLMRYGGKLRSHHWTAPGAMDGATVLGTSAHVVVQHRAGALLGLYLDGREEAASTGAAGSSTARTFILGARSTSATSTWTCGEVVLADAIEAADRQRLEGYLAWRWGLQGGLPATHPHRSAPP